MTIDTFSVDRSKYDNADNVKAKYTAKPGLNESVVRKISKDKKEPEWMLNKRLKALELFQKTKIPTWGPDLKNLDLDKIVYYVDPNAKESKSWDDVPEDIKKTFDRLGIPQAEREALSGVGAQYDSVVVYHNLKKEWEDKGVIFENMDNAVKKFPELVKKYFMTSCVPVNDHKFVMLHAAVWSGGTFIYIPPKVKVDIPLQAYFRMNQEGGGQFEHTLIIADKGSEISYIEGCFTKGNLVQTENGQVPIERIKQGELVLSHDGTYHKVKKVLSHNYSGEIFKISCYGDSTQDIETTFEHPFLWVKRERSNEKNRSWKKEWNIPKYVSKGDYLCIPRIKKIEIQSKRKFKIKEFIGRKQGYKDVYKVVKTDKDFFKLVGYYLAEGSISKGSYLNFSFGSHERDLIEDVKKLMKNVFGIEKSYEAIHEVNNGTSVVFSSVEFCRIFEQFGKSCDTKILPEWVLFEDFEKQKELLKAYWLGDGNFYSKRTAVKGFLKEVIRTNTISEKLAKQIRNMYIRLGIPAFINKRDRSKEGRKTMFTIGISGYYLKEVGKILGLKLEDKINGKKRASMFHIDEEYLYVPIKSISKRKTNKEKVYNFSISKTETYTVAGVTVHNCSAPRFNSNALHAGCVELHALEGAKIKYSSIENWSKNTYNLNTKRAIVHKNAQVDWVNGNLGSGRTMLYPCSILLGENSRTQSLGIAFAGQDQNQDTGTKVIHIGKNSSSLIRAKSISKDGGISTYRGLVKISKFASGAISSVDCDALMVGENSISKTIPQMETQLSDSQINHEAKTGKIGEEELYYLKSRGLNEEEAKQMIVSGFIGPIVKELPLEYAAELNKLIQLEMESTLG